jgi:flavin reductase (DIM6/NTAB) family NADH-FMN oxidoreductase RutF
MKKSLGAKPLIPSVVWVIGTYDDKGKPNVMTAAWVGVCCTEPPCVSVSLRESTHTFANLIEKRAFTVNVPSETYVKESDFFSLVSGRDTDKLLRTGLTAKKGKVVDAPCVEEFMLVIECKLVHTHKLGTHVMCIGEIVDVRADEQILDRDGLPDLQKLKPMLFAPESSKYYRSGGYLKRAFSIGKVYI